MGAVVAAAIPDSAIGMTNTEIARANTVSLYTAAWSRNLSRFLVQTYLRAPSRYYDDLRAVEATANAIERAWTRLAIRRAGERAERLRETTTVH